MRTICRLALTTTSLLLVALLGAPAGVAATLAPVTHAYYGWTDAVYTAGAEANKVTLGGALGRSYVLHDPNVVITTPAFVAPHVNTDPTGWQPLIGEDRSVYASFNCVAPRGRGQGICLSTPGDTCNDSGCYFHDDVRFHLARLVLGAGNDSATLLPGVGTVEVVAGGGNDNLDTRNGAVDWIDCSDGADTVAADVQDNVAPNCEAVKRGRP
jgi:hypothetical protein